MLDRLLSTRAERQGYTLDAAYTPDQAVTNMELLNPDAENLAVIFPPWHGGGRIMDTLAIRLARQGYAVADYSLHDQIIEPDVERVIASFRSIQNRITDDLHELRSAHTSRYERVHFVGASLGNVALALVASKFQDFDSATMVVPGSNLALCLWDGMRTQVIREGFEKRGVTRTALDEAWQTIAPKSQADAFKNTDVRMITSTTDEIIASEYQRELADELSSHGARVTEQPARLGHYAAVLRYCLLGKE